MFTWSGMHWDVSSYVGCAIATSTVNYAADMMLVHLSAVAK